MRRANLDNWRRYLDERKLDSKLATEWSGHARPNIRLVPSATLRDDNTQPGTSKLGGAPDLPIGSRWPTRSAYRYSRENADHLPEAAWEPQLLTFLAQINLSDVAKAGCDLPLPTSGLLLFFYDVETQPWGFDPLDAPGAQVLYVGAETSIQRQVPPQGGGRVQPIRLVADEGLPGWEWIQDQVCNQPGYSHQAFHAELHKLSDQDRDVIYNRGHGFGGWPALIQDPMELECEMVTSGVYAGNANAYADPRLSVFREGAKNWRLLLQLDSDDDFGWSWGDVGRLYFWCRENDIAEGRFDRAWNILQCT